jgi:hypothetical protein
MMDFLSQLEELLYQDFGNLRDRSRITERIKQVAAGQIEHDAKIRREAADKVRHTFHLRIGAVMELLDSFSIHTQPCDCGLCEAKRFLGSPEEWANEADGGGK